MQKGKVCSVTLPVHLRKQTSRLQKTSLSLFFSLSQVSLFMSGQKYSGCEESGFPLWPCSSAEASTGIWYFHKPQGVQLQHCCLWLLRLLTGRDCCFKTFYRERALCSVVADCEWPAGESAHLPKIKKLVWSSESRFSVHKHFYCYGE